ncbi:peptide N-acetyl-beta-D-glucosaminyl asparaginase amidase A-domain-containing protein [Elsinoe ampelina]|uniref:Peptide N-acetyl-beta-D-glucosaminyl asparaginase amidase A-domain-containing protein n=1 Tax=Elsinoe ampelina TaxID=302913 RepID=A0A6A6G3B2_9PEZI|nr:peptide N-acetyl-beta-D-glucosaminyl asparaginase amidase A-domain-containing protein [Elsinoe ampelina]
MHLLLLLGLVCIFGLPDGCIASLIIPRQGPPATNSTTPLEVIQVNPPVRFLDEAGTAAALTCQSTLVVYSFQNSYGQPYVGPYTPPSCNFNKVTWNLTVTSRGRQFDRLGTVSLGPIEVFRTSTAEPTANGIFWTYIKDVSPFLSLFKEPQTIIFDLGNIINDIYTGPFNVTLTADYYNVNEEGSEPAADLILPISKGSSNTSSVFNFPPDNATSLITLPSNVTKAVVSIAATGQSREEFWWSNLLEQDVNAFPSAGTLPGLSPFREVQLFIDGTLAGVVWPFPIIFTGGIVPGFWRPIVGIDAYDLREDEIDVSPFLPLLTDSRPHNLTLVVSGLIPTTNGTILSERVNSYWVLSAKLFLWQSPSPIPSTAPSISAPEPSISASSSLTTLPASNDTLLSYSLSLSRSLRITTPTTSWSQSLSFTYSGTYSQGGNAQVSTLLITGTDVSSSGYSRDISYPLNVTSLYIPLPDGFGLNASLTRGQTIRRKGGVFPTGLEAFAGTKGEAALLQTEQEGVADYVSDSTTATSRSTGDTRQRLRFAVVGDGDEGGQGRELYYRDVEGRNGTIVEDEVRDVGMDDGVGERRGGRGGGGKGGYVEYAPRRKGVQARFGRTVVGPPGA